MQAAQGPKSATEGPKSAAEGPLKATQGPIEPNQMQATPSPNFGKVRVQWWALFICIPKNLYHS